MLFFFCWLLAHDERLRVAMKGNGSGPGANHHLSLGRLYFILIYTSAGNVANKSRETDAADAADLAVGSSSRGINASMATERNIRLTCYAIKGRRRHRTRSEIRVYSPIYAECLILRSPSANDFSPDITARSWMASSRSFFLFSFSSSTASKISRRRRLLLLGNRPVVTLLWDIMYAQLYISAVSLFFLLCVMETKRSGVLMLLLLLSLTATHSPHFFLTIYI